MNYRKSLFLCLGILTTSIFASAQDTNFYIYLCYGQSNMEGDSPTESIDLNSVPERFRVMSTVDYSNPSRDKGEWYVAVPPLVRENTQLSLIDYFGRTMVENLDENITVGVVPVAVGGSKIEHLSKDYDPTSVVSESKWFQNNMKVYGNKPYDHLIEYARKAQKEGIIKGILLHQGESNTNDTEWPIKVKKLYDDIIGDLGLAPNSIPLVAGEVVSSEKGGVCGSMNEIITTLPDVIPTAVVVSAANLSHRGDGLHFTSESYRELGRRYAREILATMGISNLTQKTEFK